jgi:hypothetical protein
MAYLRKRGRRLPMSRGSGRPRAPPASCLAPAYAPAAVGEDLAVVLTPSPASLPLLCLPIELNPAKLATTNRLHKHTLSFTNSMYMRQQPSVLVHHLGCTFLFLTRTNKQKKTMEWRHRIFPADAQTPPWTHKRPTLILIQLKLDTHHTPQSRSVQIRGYIGGLTHT